MSNNTKKTNITKESIKMTPEHKKLMKKIYIIAGSVVALGLILSALAWCGYVPTYL